jgi:hypothetical protein
MKNFGLGRGGKKEKDNAEAQRTQRRAEKNKENETQRHRVCREEEADSSLGSLRSSGQAE